MEKLGDYLSKFPSEEHAKGVCKPGDGDQTCRYLTMSPKGWGCEKASSLKRTLDERVVKNQMRARGDNCDGLLGKILENREALKGKKIVYSESTPSFHDRGVLKEIVVQNGMLYVTAFWEQNGEDTYSYSVSDIDMRVELRSITFGIAGLGNFAGQTTILLD